MKINKGLYEKKIALFLCVIMFAITAFGQVGFGTSNPSSSAIIEMYSYNKGFLLPRIPLSSLSVPNQISSPVNSMLIFNPLNSGSIVSGYYYYSTAQSRWINIIDMLLAWNIQGNSIITPANFMGTLDDFDLVFKRNNIRAGLLNTSKMNTAFGVGALSSASLSGSMNTANGYQSMLSNTLGDINVANGYQSLFKNDIGNLNTTGGYQTLYNNTSGSRNIAFGNQSLLANINANQNIGIGFFSLFNTRASLNIGLGTQSLYYNIQGSNNVSAGFQSLFNNNGDNNVGFGVNSLFANTTGSNNVAAGTGSLNFNKTGQLNTALGNSTFIKQVTGNQNLAIGTLAADSAINLNQGIAIGFRTALTVNNQLNLVNMIFGTGLTGTVTTPSGAIGIGTVSPQSNLQINGSFATKIRTLNSGSIADDDYTILIRGDILMPTATSSNIGRVYFIVNDTNIVYQVSGLFREKGVDVNDYSLNLNSGSTAIKVQSNGTRWQIISKY